MLHMYLIHPFNETSSKKLQVLYCLTSDKSNDETPARQKNLLGMALDTNYAIFNWQRLNKVICSSATTCNR